MEAMGPGTSAFLDQRTWPVVGSTRMPSLALTPPGTPRTSSTGPAAILVADAAGTVAVTALGVDTAAAGLVAPCASASPVTPEQPANVPPDAGANPAISNRTTRRIRLQGLEGPGNGSCRATGGAAPRPRSYDAISVDTRLFA